MQLHLIQLDRAFDNKQRETHHTHFQPLLLLTYKKERIRMTLFHNIPDHLQATFSVVVISLVVLELVEMETKMETFDCLLSKIYQLPHVIHGLIRPMLHLDLDLREYRSRRHELGNNRTLLVQLFSIGYT